MQIWYHETKEYFISHREGMITRMEQRKTTAEKVAELTQEQQDRIYKCGKVALIVQICGLIPLVSLLFYSVFMFIHIRQSPLGVDLKELENAKMWVFISGAVASVYALGVLIVLKLVCPQYSESKWRYIRKMRKKK